MEKEVLPQWYAVCYLMRRNTVLRARSIQSKGAQTVQ